LPAAELPVALLQCETSQRLWSRHDPAHREIEQRIDQTALGTVIRAGEAQSQWGSSNGVLGDTQVGSTSPFDDAEVLDREHLMEHTMGNPITDNLKIGTLGELLVQFRLLEHDVQAAPPHQGLWKRSNRSERRGVSRCAGKKTSAGTRVYQRPLPDHYHILALVFLAADDTRIFLDKSKIFLVPRAAVDANSGRVPKDIRQFELSAQLVTQLF
jgi:hypothetical protein